MPSISDYYVNVSFFVRTPNIVMDGCEIAIVPQSWGGHVVPHEGVRTVRYRNMWYGQARWPKNSIVNYIIMVMISDSFLIKTRESLLRQIRLEQDNVLINLSFNDQRNVMTFFEWVCPLLPQNPTFLLAERGMEMSRYTDPTEQLILAQTRHIKRDPIQLRDVRRRRLPRTIRGKDAVNGGDKHRQMPASNANVRQPQVENHGQDAGEGQNENEGQDEIEGQNKNADKAGEIFKRCLKYALPGLGVGAVIGLVGWAWCKWKK